MILFVLVAIALLVGVSRLIGRILFGLTMPFRGFGFYRRPPRFMGGHPPHRHGGFFGGPHGPMGGFHGGGHGPMGGPGGPHGFR